MAWVIRFKSEHGQSDWTCDEEPYRVHGVIHFIHNKETLTINTKNEPNLEIIHINRDKTEQRIPWYKLLDME